MFSMAVGAIKAAFGLGGLFTLGLDGKPAMLHDNTGWNWVEQGPPSASTVELPIHSSAEAEGATTGATWTTMPGKC